MTNSDIKNLLNKINKINLKSIFSGSTYFTLMWFILCIVVAWGIISMFMAQPIIMMVMFSILLGATIVILGVSIGAWVMFKGVKPGTPFISSGKGGEVFRVPFPEDTPDFPEDAKDKEKLVSRTAEFLKNIGVG